MKKKILAMILSVIMIVAMLPMSSVTIFAIDSAPAEPVEIAATYDWYSAEAENYEIDSISDLVGLAKLTQGNVVIDEATTYTKTDFTGKTVKLTGNLTFEDNQYWYYANSDNTVVYDYRIGSFAGAFDGQENTIYGLNFYNANIGQNPNMYLFAAITADGSIKNITLDTVTADINGYDNFGFLAKNLNGTAINCHVKNVIVTVAVASNGKGYISGSGVMFGGITSGAISYCTVEGVTITLSGEDNTDGVGALVGNARGTEESRATISNCSVKDITFDCTQKTKNLGCFVGSTSNTTVTDCTATNVNVSVDNYYQNVGGFVGNVGGNSVYECCNVTGFTMDGNSSEVYGGYYTNETGDVGGFAGLISNSTKIQFDNCTVTELNMNLEIDNSGGYSAGGFIGWQGGSGITIDGCSVDGQITATGEGENDPVGGFIGVFHRTSADTQVTDCVVNTTISTSGTAGGFVGVSKGGTFVDCEANGTVSGDTAGGFIGEIVPNTANTNLTVNGCEANGAVTGETVAAGFVGSMTTSGENNTNPINVVISNSTGASELTSETGRVVDFAEETIAEGSTSHFHNMIVTLSSDKDACVIGDTVLVYMNISDEANDAFNSSELEITYPAENLTFNVSGSTLNGASAVAENGVLSIADYGASQNYGNGVYILAFTATRTGTASIALKSAGLGTADSAVKEDLVKFNCENVAVTITVKHKVTLPDIFSGAASVANGERYTFSIESATGVHYNYVAPTATVGGLEATVIANGDGTWTVENVTGELVIIGSRTPKTHNVTIVENTFATGNTTAIYGTDYTFTLADDLAASTQPGYYYTVKSVTIDGLAYTGYSVNDRFYTIPGTAVTGEIVITISKTVTEPNQFVVSTTGNAEGDVSLSQTVVDINEDVTLTITPERGYVYTVTAGGYEVKKNGNAYTVSNVTTPVSFAISKIVDVTTADTGSYLTLNNSQTVNYVKIGEETPLEGKTYTYKGQEMFWSKAYKAYVTVVIDGDPTITAEDFAIVDGEATVIAEGEKDINKSGTTDANDAQLVYNIYMSEYTAFTADVTVEKFLRADVNGDYKIDMNDAVAIVNSILGVFE